MADGSYGGSPTASIEPDIDDEALSSRIRDEHTASADLNANSSLSTERARNLNYYLGDMPDLPKPGVGRSGVVSEDVGDVVDGLMPDILEIFSSSDEIISFIPLGDEDQEASEQETKAVHHVIFQLNDGFGFLHDVIKDGLLTKVGYGRVFNRDCRRVEHVTYDDLSESELAMLSVEEDVQIVKQTELPAEERAPDPNEEPGEMGALPMQAPEKHYKVEARVVERYRETAIEPVAPEDVAVSASCRSDISKATYVCQSSRMPASQLVELGIDKELVDALPTAPATSDTTSDGKDRPEARSRSSVNEEERSADKNPSNRIVEVWRHYIETDVDDDGVSERLSVITDKAYKVLKKEYTDENDYISWSPIRISHRHIGRSPADKAIQYQRMNTSLWRTLMDNFYHTTTPRPVVGDDIVNEHTIDDLLMITPGLPIRTAKTVPLPVYQPQPVAPAMVPMMEALLQRQEVATGFTRAGAALTGNSFGRSATGANAVMAKGEKLPKMFARMFAETGLRNLYLKVHRCLRKAGGEKINMKFGREWQAIDPREWKRRRHMVVDVNLGAVTPDQEMAHAAQMLQMALSAVQLQGGLMGPILYPAQLYNIAKNFIEAGGKRNVDDYVSDPRETPVDEQELQQALQSGLQPEKLIFFRKQGVTPMMLAKSLQGATDPTVEAAKVQSQAFLQAEDVKAKTKARSDVAVARMKAVADRTIAQEKNASDEKVAQMDIEQKHRSQLATARMSATAEHRRHGMALQHQQRLEGLKQKGAMHGKLIDTAQGVARDIATADQSERSAAAQRTFDGAENARNRDVQIRIAKVKAKSGGPSKGGA